MDIWEVNKLFLFIAFVVPGFISLKTYDLLQPGLTKDSSQQIIDAVTYSSVNYALLLWPIYAIETNEIRLQHPTLYIIFYVFSLLIAPICWVFAFLRLRKSEFFQKTIAHPTVKPWDYVFSKRGRYWVIATLNNGEKIGGRYDAKSFVSHGPAPHQIYLEEAWVINEAGGLERPRSETAGIIICAAEIVAIELFHIREGEDDDGQTED